MSGRRFFKWLLAVLAGVGMGVLLSACGSDDQSVYFFQRLEGGAVQGISLRLSTEVSTFSGTAGISGSTDGIGADARFYQPYGITTDGKNLYVTDRRNYTIRKIVIATGEVSTLAGTAGVYGTADGIGAAASFREPTGITTDGRYLYVSDKGADTIRKIEIATAQVSTLAGSSVASGAVDGIGSDARFNEPYGLTIDGGNLYVADSQNHLVRKVVIATAEVTTLAGTAGVSGTVDGTGTAAMFNEPRGITTNGSMVYVADSMNHTIRMIDPVTAEVTTIAGTVGIAGAVDGIGTAASFSRPVGLTCDGKNIYVADYENHMVRKMVITTREVTTIAGTGATGFEDNVIGTLATFNQPSGLTTDGHSLFVVDRINHTIRRID